MSTTGNIITAPLPATPGPRSRLRRLRRCRLQCGAASAASPDPSRQGFDGTKFGERVIALRFECTGRRPVHFFGKIAAAVAAFVATATPVCASAASAAPPPAVPAHPVVGQSVADFYRGRNDYPLWLATNAGDAADQLLTLLSSASLDGLDPAKYHVGELQQGLVAARSGKKKQVAEVDRALSQAFVSYVADLKQDPGVGLAYVDASLKPAPPTPLATLLTAATAPSLSDYVHNMGWMHPFYAQLRDALATHGYSTDQQRDLLQINLQ